MSLLDESAPSWRHVLSLDERSNNIKLVNTIKKYPCIYNTTVKDYLNKEVREDAWREVAAEMLDHVQSCKTRWKSLRTVFIRRMKLTKKGSKKRYYLNDCMQFIIPFIKPVEPAVEDDKETDEEHSDDNNDVVASDVNLPRKVKFFPKKREMRSSNNRMKMREDEPRLKKFRMCQDDGMLSNYRREMEDDPRRQFLLSLLPDVHAMTNAQMRKFKVMVINAMDNILDESQNNNIPKVLVNKKPTNMVLNHMQTPNVETTTPSAAENSSNGVVENVTPSMLVDSVLEGPKISIESVESLGKQSNMGCDFEGTASEK